jgi:protein TonB
VPLAEDRNRDRFKAGLGVAACHLLIGYALVTGLRYEVVRDEIGRSLKLFDVADPPPPPVEKPVPAQKTRTPEGAAAPPSLKANPSPVVVPPPKVRISVPTPLPAVPKPSPLPPGGAATAGATETPGAGSGTGGEGSGTGGGGQGSGSGGGGASRAARITGSISGASDYPPAAKRAGIEGSVTVRYTVGLDGRASGCAVTRSSGNAELDAATCRIIERRFRYRPAKDRQGRSVAETVRRTFDWLLPYRRPATRAEP